MAGKAITCCPRAIAAAMMSGVSIRRAIGWERLDRTAPGYFISLALGGALGAWLLAEHAGGCASGVSHSTAGA